MPFNAYLEALMADLDQDLAKVSSRTIRSIFFGGGTPSLFSPAHFNDLLAKLAQKLHFMPSIEITMEANPGTLECGDLSDYRQAGINRLSLGVQSFNDHMLKKLGRIHHGEAARVAINRAIGAGFSAINIDIMEALPGQTVITAMQDLSEALSFNPQHLSWYQLTLEPGTHFYKRPPRLPDDDLVVDIESAGQAMLSKHGLVQYEVSAYARPGYASVHNLNYWRYGDYLGIGAGAHSKYTDVHTGQVMRDVKQKQPKHYLNADIPFVQSSQPVLPDDRAFEFMLNHLRLKEGVDLTHFDQKTGLSREVLSLPVQQGVARGLLRQSGNTLHTTVRGYRYLNDTVALFLTPA